MLISRPSFLGALLLGGLVLSACGESPSEGPGDSDPAASVTIADPEAAVTTASPTSGDVTPPTGAPADVDPPISAESPDVDDGVDGPDSDQPDTTDGAAEEDPSVVVAAVGGDADPGDATALISIEIADGIVVGGPKRVKVDAGSVVVIEVALDAADEVHLHGYDFSVAGEAGDVVQIAFNADIPGVWAVELEVNGGDLVELEVS